MAISSVISKYIGKSSAMDGVWEESKHHRADDGKFTSGTGRGKTKGDSDANKDNSSKDSDKRQEMSEEQATKIVRAAFKEANKELQGLKLVDHALNASVNETDDGTLTAINEYLTKNGLKAKISDKTTFKIAEDGYDDIQVADDPILEVLVDLCKIDMVAKDLHYRAKGKPFYGLHELADIAWGINRLSDDVNEVYYMGEKQIDPPDRAYVAGKAAELVGKAGGEDELIQKLMQICDETAKAVENAKNTGVSSGTAAVLDDVSKKSLQAKGLLARTMKSVENGKTIDAVISKGIAIKPEAVATDSGTSEGAKKGWMKRLRGYSDMPVEGDTKAYPRGNFSEHIQDDNHPARKHYLNAINGKNPATIKSGLNGLRESGHELFEMTTPNGYTSIGFRKINPTQDSGTSEGAKKGWETRIKGSLGEIEASHDKFGVPSDAPKDVKNAYHRGWIGSVISRDGTKWSINNNSGLVEKLHIPKNTVNEELGRMREENRK